MQETNDRTVDNAGTTQEDALDLIRSLRDDVFATDTAKTALALGLTDEEFRSVLNGDREVDDDLVMKARGIAQQRGGETGLGKTA